MSPNIPLLCNTFSKLTWLVVGSSSNALVSPWGGQCESPLQARGAREGSLQSSVPWKHWLTTSNYHDQPRCSHSQTDGIRWQLSLVVLLGVLPSGELLLCFWEFFRRSTGRQGNCFQGLTVLFLVHARQAGSGKSLMMHMRTRPSSICRDEPINRDRPYLSC